jgi:transcriptional regulator with XRE-family HTH domain
MDALDREGLAARTLQAIALIGLSQRQVANRIGVSPGFISSVGSAKSLPSLQMVAGLWQEFGVSPEWYLLGVGEPFVSEKRQPQVPADVHDIVYQLLPAVLALGPAAQAQLRGYLHSMLDAATRGQRRAQAG